MKSIPLCIGDGLSNRLRKLRDILESLMRTKPILLTTRETASVLRIQRSKLYELIHTGVVQAIRIGTEWRIPTDCIERLCATSLPEDYFIDVPKRQQSTLPHTPESRATALAILEQLKSSQQVDQ